KAIAGVRFGQTIAYAELAQRAGRSGSARAAGAATGRNPISIIVPCHRIVGSNGSLTGYAGGLAKKRALLALEGRVLLYFLYSFEVVVVVARMSEDRLKEL